MPKFDLKSTFEPTGDQPVAIQQLVKGLNDGEKYQILHGATATGKTFTMANVIEKVQRPTIVMAHNKTLAAQLYGEFKQFFPNNRVEYFLSSFDYYLPESYNPTTGKYLEKDSMINDEIEKLRLSTIISLQSGRRDVIVVSTVSCIFGAGNPTNFKKNILKLDVGMKIDRNEFLKHLVQIGYYRLAEDFTYSKVRVRGDVIDVHHPIAKIATRIYFFDDVIEKFSMIDAESGHVIESSEDCYIYPAKIYNADLSERPRIVKQMADDLVKQVVDFEKRNMLPEAKRLKTRTEYDIEMINEIGWCNGIENYSRYIDDRETGQRPRCLFDYFPEDYLMFIDESHVTVPQVKAMFSGAIHMKQNLVDYGWRLAAALDNRPLKFNEFEDVQNQVIYVTATPAEYELKKTEGVVVEQVIRPTGLVDPSITVRPTKNQIDDLLNEIDDVIRDNDRVLITTLTKKMSESLAEKMTQWGRKAVYMHSDIKPIDRMQILRQLRLGEIDVLIGVNLLREGLDLPEVGLVVIMDADKEGFLRSDTSMIQTIGRAARNVNGRVIMYADKVTGSMQRAIEETDRRRNVQIEYNLKNNITPLSIKKSVNEIMKQTDVAKRSKANILKEKLYEEKLHLDPILLSMSKKDLEFQLKMMHKDMLQAAKDLDFATAAKLRDTIKMLEEEKTKR